MKPRDLIPLLVVGLALPALIGAQRGAAVPVRGIVFDSLRGQPMRNAFVSIAGSAQTITTDSRGRFQFDSIEPGLRHVTAQHPILDSIGFSGLSAHLTITDGRGEIQLAIPSFGTLWRVACGDGKVPKDSAIVYGTIRDASSGLPVADARVELAWSDLRVDRPRHVVQRRWRIETRTNTQGGYAACGVAADLGLQLHAVAGSQESSTIDLAPLTTRVQRRDLFLGSSDARDSTHRGTITGLVTDPSGRPVADARVLVDSLPEVRTADDGSFSVRSVPAGTRQVQVLLVGAPPTFTVADVTPDKPTVIAVAVRKIPTLATVRTEAARKNRLFAAEFEARRRSGFGYVRDSTEISQYAQFLNVLRTAPGLNVQYRSSTLTLSVSDGSGGSCAPRVLIDGAEAGFNHLIDLMPKEIAGVEVYVRASHIPPRFVPTGIQQQCGMVLVWTKYGMKNR